MSHDREDLVIRLSTLLRENYVDDYPMDFNISIKELTNKGYEETTIRQVLKQDFKMYIDDYGIPRRITTIK